MASERQEEPLVTVYVTQGMLRANVIHGLLQSAGIPAMLSYEAAGPAIGMVIDGLGRVEVKVPTSWANEARELLSADPAPDDASATDEAAATDDASATDEAPADSDTSEAES